jgi:hypothetical protein
MVTADKHTTATLLIVPPARFLEGKWLARRIT